MLRHLRTRWPVVAGIALIVFGIVAAEQWGLYYRIPNFDKVLHVTGGAIAAWFALSLLQDDVTRLKPWKQALIIVAIACTIGTVWEWAEFFSNGTQHTFPVWYHYFHGGDLTDTIGDLIADVTGAVLFAGWVLYKERA
jgi:hypothetical protein